MLYLCITKSLKLNIMSFTTEIEIRRCELRAKEIFAKPTITDADAQLGKHLIEKWKRLTGWIERTELPILIN